MKTDVQPKSYFIA